MNASARACPCEICLSMLVKFLENESSATVGGRGRSTRKNELAEIAVTRGMFETLYKSIVR